MSRSIICGFSEWMVITDESHSFLNLEMSKVRWEYWLGATTDGPDGAHINYVLYW